MRRASESKKNGETVQRLFSGEVPPWKACMDVVGSLALIILCLLCFCSWLPMSRLYPLERRSIRQNRVGQGGRTFTFLNSSQPMKEQRPVAHREYLKALIRNGSNGKTRPSP